MEVNLTDVQFLGSREPVGAGAETGDASLNQEKRINVCVEIAAPLGYPSPAVNPGFPTAINKRLLSRIAASLTGWAFVSECYSPV